jgi:DNA-binding transcriptional LysR family regulator
MRRTPYGEFTAFMAVAEERNFTRAAKQIGISTATLSQTIRALEERLGVRLLNRTTRSVAPTEAGERLLSRLKPVIEDYESAIDSINEFRDKPAGLVRLTIAPPAAHSVIGPRLARFVAQYPDIRLEISVDSANIDIVSQQFDAGIRAEHRIDRDMIAVRVGEQMQSIVVASPAYLARHPEPKLPRDLQAHNCIRFRLSSGGILPWRFEKDAKSFEIAVTGSLILNDVGLVKYALMDGAGIAYVPRGYLASALAEGQLVTLLEEWTPPESSFFLYYPSRRQTPAALRALIDFLRQDKNTPADAKTLVAEA